MPKSRIRISLLVAAIVGELLLLAWLFRSKWLPLPAPAANPAPVALAPTVPVPGVAAAASKPVATKPAGVPFTADICGVGKVPLFEKPHSPDDDVWLSGSVLDADGNPSSDPPQFGPDPNAPTPRDQSIDDWLLQRTASNYKATESALRNSGDARLLAISMWLGKYEPDKGGWTGAMAHDRVALALGTRDPVLYGIVYASCRGMAVPAAMTMHVTGCEPMNAQHWTELDPHNAVPWLVAALEADVAGNVAAVADAMHHAAQATTYDTYARTLANAVDRQVQGEPDSIEHVAVESELVATVADEGKFNLDPVLRYCARGHMDSEGRRAECDKISTFLIVSGTTENELNVGLHVARITDPGQPALESVRQLRDLMIFPGLPPGAHWSCRYRDQKQKVIQAYLAGGAVAARLALREQFETAPPAFTREQADELDAYMERTATMPLLLPADPAGP